MEGAHQIGGYMMTDHAILTFPFPPTTNNLFVNRAVGGRFHSQGYKAWITEADLVLAHQYPLPKFTGTVSLRLSLGPPDKRKRDLSNFVKAIEDRLVAHNVLRDDSDVWRLEVFWDRSIKGARVEITPMGAVA